MIFSSTNPLPSSSDSQFSAWLWFPRWNWHFILALISLWGENYFTWKLIELFPPGNTRTVGLHLLTSVNQTCIFLIYMNKRYSNTIRTYKYIELYKIKYYIYLISVLRNSHRNHLSQELRSSSSPSCWLPAVRGSFTSSWKQPRKKLSRILCRYLSIFLKLWPTPGNIWTIIKIVGSIWTM